MARLFNGSNEYLELDSTPVTAAPLTIVARFYQDDVSTWANRCIAGVFDLSSPSNWFVLKTKIDGAGNYIRADTRSSSGWQEVASTAQFSGNTWHHAAAVFASSTSRTVYLDGGNSATNTTSVTPSGIDRISIARLGDSSPGNYMSGRVAEVAMYNAALSADEIASLARGFSPLLIRTQNLVGYWPLIRDGDRDCIGGYNLVAHNTPTIATHVPVLYPARPFVIFMSGTSIIPAAASLSGVGTLEATANIAIPAAAALSGVGTLEATANIAIPAAAALSGVGTLEATANIAI
ncbi:MAG: hypothetical protein DRP56_02370, partial [Planctomycetota bacterium]